MTRARLLADSEKVTQSIDTALRGEFKLAAAPAYADGPYSLISARHYGTEDHSTLRINLPLVAVTDGGVARRTNARDFPDLYGEWVYMPEPRMAPSAFFERARTCFLANEGFGLHVDIDGVPRHHVDRVREDIHIDSRLMQQLAELLEIHHPRRNAR